MTEYMHPGLDFARGKAIEEMGELTAALGKSIRWGWNSVNPELPLADQETNEDWVRREMHDVYNALKNLELEMIALTWKPPRRRTMNNFNKSVLVGTFQDDIREFYEKFGLEYAGPPRTLPQDLDDFRGNFLQEEVDEYRGSSHNTCDHVPERECLATQLDSLVDIVYVALGTAYLHGFDFAEAWRRVHEANMQKVRAPSAAASRRNSAHDVVKPEGWTPPDLADLV